MVPMMSPVETPMSSVVVMITAKYMMAMPWTTLRLRLFGPARSWCNRLPEPYEDDLPRPAHILTALLVTLRSERSFSMKHCVAMD